ncbi:hypothetical protein EJ08DRAFT_734607 [Tothia fuscella]|uniref:DUF3074 domain-containing protein n=1 Tax=Tothia fuscella TaxID=1048955 RepID=A0A9P4TX14_9PEZI|nr:hypothetical protein EJ08DRAFT_734607 [Tothia fuscella]
MTSSKDTRAPTLGHLVRLHVLSPSELPSHPVLSSSQKHSSTDTSASPHLKTFITQALTEGATFIDKTIPQTFRPTNTKPSPPSEASVASSKRKISKGDILNGIKEGKPGFAKTWRDEVWFARRSVHVQGREMGRASWIEFVDGLLRNHSLNEADYTPNVFDAREIGNWEDELRGIEFEGYDEVRMFIYEMSHHIPFPLYNRTFPTLVISAIDSAKTGTSSFVLVQIPVDLTSVLTALYSTGKNRTELRKARQKKKVVLGQYVSVERCKVVDERGHEDDGKVVWDMATASDARGWLPMALQKLGVPGAVVKDVGCFMKWTAGKRARNGPQTTSDGAAS